MWRLLNSCVMKWNSWKQWWVKMFPSSLNPEINLLISAIFCRINTIIFNFLNVKFQFHCFKSIKYYFNIQHTHNHHSLLDHDSHCHNNNNNNKLLVMITIPMKSKWHYHIQKWNNHFLLMHISQTLNNLSPKI
jgi:hypothetical protein